MKTIEKLNLPFEAWLEEKKEALAAFAVYWRRQNLEDPESFPMEIPRGDWEEQFDFFQEEV